MLRIMKPKMLVVGIALSLFAGPLGADDWPAFRGPKGNGVSSEKNAPLTWSADKNVKWKVALPQPANGSPIVSNGRVFVTAAEDKEGRQRSLYCFDRKDGKKLWVRTVKFAKKMPTHSTNPYCGSTPAASGKRVVVWHASAGLVCYDFKGKELWKREFGDFRHMWGYGSSPIILGDKVILHTGPGKDVFVAALELSTGKTIWKNEEPVDGTADKRTDGAYLGSWTTPVVARVDGKDQVICIMPTRLVAYDPDSGELVWSCDGIRGPRGDLAYSSPMIAGDLCVAYAGFAGPAIGVRLGGKGNVTESHRVWLNEKNPQNIGSGVFVGGHIYRPNSSPATVECIDPKTGKVLWTERTGRANYWGSMVLAAGRLYVTDQKGTTIVFKPNPDKFEELARNALGEPSNSTPAVSDGEIFIQTHKHLYCIAE